MKTTPQKLFFRFTHCKGVDLLQPTRDSLKKSPSILAISIYTLSDLGDLSNLIGSLSRTIQQYSPPSQWIMCELGVFPIF